MAVPILFLHGWTMCGATFNAVRAQLEPDHYCVAPDLPGHGCNTGSAASMDRSVAEVTEQISALDRPLLVGWSMGAAIAWNYIAEAGCAGLRGLVTVDMSPKLLPEPTWPHGLRAQSPEEVLATGARFRTDWPRAARGITRNMFAGRDKADETAKPALQGDQQAQILAALLGQNPDLLCPIWDDMVSMDVRSVLPKVSVPYLVLHGAKSTVYDCALADWIARQAPKARSEIFARSGHSPHLEEPEAFAATLRGFLMEL